MLYFVLSAGVIGYTVGRFHGRKSAIRLIRLQPEEAAKKFDIILKKKE